MAKFKAAVTPTWVNSLVRYRHEKKDILSRQLPESDAKAALSAAKAKMKKEISVAVAKVVLAEAFYDFTGSIYSVGGRDWGLSFNQKTAMGDASKFSVRLVSSLVGLIPQHKQETLAAIAFPAEMAVFAIRVYVEQKVWQKIGMTSEIAGTALTPYCQGALELGSKISMAYPQSPQERISVSMLGIYGSLVRMAHAGIFLSVGLAYNKHFARQEQPA